MQPPFYGENRPQPKKNPPKKTQKKKTSSFFWTFVKALLTLGIWGICALCLAILWFSYDLPDINQLHQSHRKASVVIQSINGETIGTYGDLYEDTVKLSELPPYVYQAVLAIEDRRFYYHFGLDFIGLIRAAYTNYQADRVVQGGSTITQQLSKNFLQTQGLYSTHDKSLRRKVQEAIMSLWLEWHFTKEQILTIYLNRVYLGAGTYGIDAAARKYFHKSARNLNVYQAAVIAGLLKAPSRYSPLSNPERAYTRASVVLQQMGEAGYITHPEQYLAQAKQELADKSNDQKNQNGTKFFTDWVYDQIPSYVPIDQDLIISTTFDPSMQRHAEKVCAEHREMGKELKASEIAFVSMATDGAVKCMVGGYDYNKSQFNRAKALRQPGSTFKVFVYLAGLENGMTPYTMIDDTPVRIGNWAPSSFKWQSRGEVTIKEAFARSVNPVTVRIGQAVGAKKIIKVANRLGITSKMTPDLSITLGSMDTTLIQMTAAVGTFAHHGLAVWPYAITEIRNREGKVLYRREPGQPVRVIEKEHLAAMRDMLGAVVQYGTGRAAKSATGGKSGSNGDRDAWFIGYTDKLVSGVWIGNDKGEPMEKRSVGGRMPARVWEAFHSTLSTAHLQSEDSDDVDTLVAAIADGDEDSPHAHTHEQFPTGTLSHDKKYRPSGEPSAQELEHDTVVDELINAMADLPAIEVAPAA